MQIQFTTKIEWKNLVSATSPGALLPRSGFPSGLITQGQMFLVQQSKQKQERERGLIQQREKMGLLIQERET